MVSGSPLRLLALLWVITLAPACAPDPAPAVAPGRTRNLVLLTDTTAWPAGALRHYRDSLTGAGFRVVVSGYPGESAAQLSGRLPWLLQPGVDVFVYDPALAGPAGLDSLRALLARRHLTPTVLGR